jgi:hypothetical protein
VHFRTFCRCPSASFSGVTPYSAVLNDMMEDRNPIGGLAIRLTG